MKGIDKSISNKIKDRVKSELIEMKDLKFLQFHSKLCPGVNNLIGVRVPIIRKYVKKLYIEYNGDISLLVNSIDDEYYEEVMLKGFLIGMENKDFNKLVKYVYEFVPKIDNWAICDSFCASLKLTNKYKDEMWNFIINNYSKSTFEYEIRFMVVMILDYYIDDKYLNKVFSLFNSINTDCYYANMAISWALSICLIKYFDITVKYLKSSDCNLSDFVYNKALQKGIESFRICGRNKEILRELKR